MENLYNTTEACLVADDDLLNFTLEDGEGEKEVDPTIFKGGASASSSSLESSNPAAATETASFVRGTQTGLFPEFVEEELEWLSNKDAFPAVETCFGILSDNPELISNHQSPISVLENSSNSNTNSSSLNVPTNYPVRARTKRRKGRRAGLGDSPSQHCFRPGQVRNVVKKKRDFSFSLPPLPVMMNSSGGGGGGGGGGMGRRCLHCQADKTPQWRAGPMGPKTLCNACGVRYKSGRLLPEYRPANSPTFSSVLHSNSHRKVVEMRKQKEVATGGVGVNVGGSCGYRVG